LNILHLDIVFCKIYKSQALKQLTIKKIILFEYFIKYMLNINKSDK